MKKGLSAGIVFAILFAVLFAMASMVSAQTTFDVVIVDSLTGKSTSLDSVVRTEHFPSYKDGTVAVLTIPESPLSFYVYDADCEDPESSPAIIIPNNNTSGKGAWRLTGTAGVSGATWLNTAGVPGAGTGAVNDFCINTLNYDIYKKTAADTWTLIGNIKGDQGDAGVGLVNDTVTASQLAADPADPADGDWVLWVSDGTGAGDAGDVMMKITAGATTKTITVVDFSAAP